MKKKRVAAVEPLADGKYLTAAEHIAVVMADKEAAIAALEVERDAARFQAFKLQTQMQLTQGEQGLQEKRARAEAATQARRSLVDDIAQRYAIDWNDVALEPLTGQLIAVARD